MRVKVSVTLSADLADEARRLGLNMSRIVDSALIEETKAEWLRCQKDRADLDEDGDDPG
jgi:post-segregation antitoxin (ccd killing protein)